MRKFLIVIVLLMMPTVRVAGQEFTTFGERLFGGGALGLNLGNRVTQIDVQPLGGVWLLRQWCVGVSGRYSFRSVRFTVGEEAAAPRRSHMWGVSAFTQVLPVPDLDYAFGVGIHGGPLVHGEYEWLYVSRTLAEQQAAGRRWAQVVMLGPGWRQQLGRRSALELLVLWAIPVSRFNPYLDNPLLRLNFTF